MSKTIQIEVPAGKKAEWQEVDGKTVLVMVDKKDNRPVTERIKTFEDACNELGEDHPAVLAYRNTDLRDPEVAELNRDIIAYMKLRIITEALNEGWHPDYTKCEYRYHPWFYVYTKKEYDNFSEEKKTLPCRFNKCVWRSRLRVCKCRFVACVSAMWYSFCLLN